MHFYKAVYIVFSYIFFYLDTGIIFGNLKRILTCIDLLMMYLFLNPHNI